MSEPSLQEALNALGDDWKPSPTDRGNDNAKPASKTAKDFAAERKAAGLDKWEQPLAAAIRTLDNKVDARSEAWRALSEIIRESDAGGRNTTEIRARLARLKPGDPEADSVILWLAERQARKGRQAGRAAKRNEGSRGSTARVEVPTKPKTDGDWRKLLDYGSTAPHATASNAKTALANAPEWSGVLAYDRFAKAVMLLRAPPWAQDGSTWVPRKMTDIDATNAGCWLQAEDIRVRTNVAYEAMVAVAHEASFHPVRDYLDGLSWDGTARLDRVLIDHLGAEDTELNRVYGAKIMIAAVARIMQPGCKVDTVLALEGAQGIRKSTFCKTLCADDAWFTDHVEDLASKDAMQGLQGRWIIEHAEYDKLGRAGKSRAKAFISQSVDKFRAPYGRVVEEHRRECVFVVTINPNGLGYLNDETGNRRFWPVRCGVGWDAGRKVDMAALETARDQLWAEAVVRYQAGEPWWLDAVALETAQAESVSDRAAEDVWSANIELYLACHRASSTDEILSSLCIAEGDRNAVMQSRVAAVMCQLGWRSERLRVRGIRARYWVRQGVTNEAATEILAREQTGEDAPLSELLASVISASNPAAAAAGVAAA